LAPATGPFEAIGWPDDWPDLHDPRVRKPPSVYYGNVEYCLYLDCAHYEDLQRLNRKVVRINDRMWHLWCRFPFPAEDAWLTLGDQPD